MSFAAPIFLYALAAIAIPIILHLFDLQRTKKAFFTNVKLLKNINQQTSSTRKLKRFWVLMARIFAIIFLVLAFAQPFLPGKNSNYFVGNQTIAFYIDNSMSMQSSDGQKPLLELARKTAEKLSDLFPISFQFVYLDNFFLPKDKKPISRESFKDRLSETTFSENSQTLSSILEKQKSTIENTASSSKKIFWLSDFQKSTSGNLNKLTIDSTLELYLVPFQNQAASNIYVDSVWLDNVFVKINEKSSLKVRLKNSGNKKSKNLAVKLTLDDIQTGTARVEIGSNSETTINFDFIVKTLNLKRGKISFEDSPVSFDDNCFFTIDVATSLNILLLTENKQSFIEKVYQNEPIFKTNRSVAGNLPLNKLNEAHLIVAENFDKLSSADLQLLVEQSAKGKSIFLIPSENPSINDLTTASSIFGLTPIGLNVQSSDDQNEASNQLKPLDLKNPFFMNIFEAKDKNMALPSAKGIIDWGNKGQILLETKHDKAFVSIFRKSKAKIYLASAPFSDKYTNFQRHSIFVPFMYKVAMQSAEVNKKMAYNFDEKNVAIHLKLDNSVDKIHMVKEQFNYLPDQSFVGNQLVFNIPRENNGAGFYELIKGDSLITTIAININKEESKLEKYTVSDLKSIFKGKKNVFVDEIQSGQSFVEDFKEGNLGISLWKYCLALAMVFLLIEILLIRFLKL